jgi:hypothetical protein
MIKLKVGILFLILSVLVATPSYCQNNVAEKQVKSVQGTITEVSWVASTIVVRWLEHSRTLTYDEISVFVPSGTKITKGASSITLGNLNVCDRVIVTYYDDPRDQGPLKALSIRVLK